MENDIMEENVQENAENLDLQPDTQQEEIVQTKTDDRASAEIDRFTKEEMELIITRRMEAEKKRYQAMQEELESNYKKKEFQLMARDKLLNQGMPLEVLNLVEFQDKATLDKMIDLLNEHMLKREQAVRKEMLAGKTPPAGTSGNIVTNDPMKKVWGLE